MLLTQFRSFVAIEEAILEYPVNIDARKQFPGVSFL